MSTNFDRERDGCIFLWKVVNISQCWFEKDYCCESPTFIAHAVYSSEWFLQLKPTCVGNMLGVNLVRSQVCKGPLKIAIKYRIDLLNKSGEFSMSICPENKIFCQGNHSVMAKFEREKIFGSEREKFLPEDTLTIQCTVWTNEEPLLCPKQVSARTVFNVNRGSFVWKIKEFSNLKTGVGNQFKDNLLELDLIVNYGQYSKELEIKCIKIDPSIKYFLFQYFIKRTEGINDLVTREYFSNNLQERFSMPLFFTTEVFRNKSLYLSGDTLTLDCHYVYSTATAVHDYFHGGLISPKTKNVVVNKKNEFPYEKEKQQRTSALAKDFKSIFNNKDFSDIELRTATKTFPAHKLILIARSPVFRKMFSNDMRENNSGHIDIDDLEEDTVHQMLQYIYTDSLADLQFEKACKLYLAADKYEILALRSLCSSFLKDNLCPGNACGILELADRHQDEVLKNTAQDFILSHEEIFGSQEWKSLMATKIQLAAEVMYKKCHPV